MRALLAIALAVTATSAAAGPRIGTPYIVVVMERACPQVLPMQAELFRNAFGKVFGLPPAAVKAELSGREAREGIAAAQLKWDLSTETEWLQACSELARDLSKQK
ncbi:hypothetical protein [Chitinimonas naiadis]